MADVNLKRGAPLSLTIEVVDDQTGLPVPLIGAVMLASVRAVDGYGLIADGSPVATEVVGEATLSFLDTSAWPLGLAVMDIRISSPPTLLYTNTTSIMIEREVTSV